MIHDIICMNIMCVCVCCCFWIHLQTQHFNKKYTKKKYGMFNIYYRVTSP